MLLFSEPHIKMRSMFLLRSESSKTTVMQISHLISQNKHQLHRLFYLYIIKYEYKNIRQAYASQVS